MADDNNIDSFDGSATTIPGLVVDQVNEWMNQAADFATNSKDGAIDLGERSPLSVPSSDLSRLVRLDKVCLAIFLMAARYALRDQLNILRKIQEDAVTLIKSFVGVSGSKFLIKKTAWRAIPGLGWLITLVGQIVSLLNAEGYQFAARDAIRFESLLIRNDLVTESLRTNPAKHPRKIKVVFTRHPIPRQRKPNQSWHSPRK